LSLFNELNRRNVIKVSIAYLVIAWLVMQVADVILNNVDAPNWVFHVILLLLGIGFIFAIIFAWVFELTPDGLKREHEVDIDRSITRRTGRKLDYVIIGVLVVGLSYFAYDKFVLSAVQETAPIEKISLSGDKQAETQKAVIGADKSIAILPFVNMSDDASNEYFSDGLSEELLNLLAKVPELRVAARTSSFSFKGKDLKISEIARELNVSHILEGSVRKSGDQVRITAQLIKADHGFHLWSESYNRTLDDIFAVQDEIASEVSKALQVTLLGRTRSKAEINPEAYSLYLKGMYFLNQGSREFGENAIQELQRAIELEPEFAGAWQILAFVYYQQIRARVISHEEGHALAMDAINRAMNLDPNQGVIWGTYGFLKKNLDWDWEEAQQALSRAYELEPGSNLVRIWRASTAQTLGRLDEALDYYELALATDPLNLSAYSSVGICNRKVGRFDVAITIFEQQIELRPRYHWAYFNIGKAYLFKGDAETALAQIEKNPSNVYREVGLVLAYTTLGREEEAQAALQRLVADYGEQFPNWVAEAYSWRGDSDRAFEWLGKAYQQRDIGLSYLLGNKVFERLWGDPRWLDLLKKLKLYKHWLDMSPEYGGPANRSN
jgi:TolB-like protein/cytochrome c-type biogenesis protein CcmH/NrfG